MTVKSTNDQVIRNRDYMTQATVFEGCSSVGGFTDIDACYDVKGKALVLIEVKKKNCAITTGQKILFDRMVMWCQKPVYAMTVWHDTPEGEDIILKDCEVVEVRVKGPDGKAVVKPSGKKITVAQAIAYIEKKHGVSK